MEVAKLSAPPNLQVRFVSCNESTIKRWLSSELEETVLSLTHELFRPNIVILMTSVISMLLTVILPIKHINSHSSTFTLFHDYPKDVPTARSHFFFLFLFLCSI